MPKHMLVKLVRKEQEQARGGPGQKSPGPPRASEPPCEALG